MTKTQTAALINRQRELLAQATRSGNQAMAANATRRIEKLQTA